MRRRQAALRDEVKSPQKCQTSLRRSTARNLPRPPVGQQDTTRAPIDQQDTARTPASQEEAVRPLVCQKDVAETATIINDIFASVESGNVTVLETLLAKHRLEVDVRDSDLCTMLMRCANVADVPRMRHMMCLLLEKGADVNARDGRGKTALMHACLSRCSADLLSILLSERDCQVNAQDHFGNTALMYCVYINNVSALQLLMTSAESCNNIKVSVGNQDGVTPVLLARRLRHDECEQLLVQNSNDLQSLLSRQPHSRQASLERTKQTSGAMERGTDDRLGRNSRCSRLSDGESEFEGRKLPLALRRALQGSALQGTEGSRRRGSSLSRGSAMSRSSRATHQQYADNSQLNSRATTPSSCLSIEALNDEFRSAPRSRSSQASQRSGLAGLTAHLQMRPGNSGGREERSGLLNVYRQELRSRQSRHSQRRQHLAHYSTKLPPIIQRDGTSVSQADV